MTNVAHHMWCKHHAAPRPAASPFGVYTLCISCDKARVLQCIAVQQASKDELISSLCTQRQRLEAAWLDAIDVAFEKNHLRLAYNAHEPLMDVERQIAIPQKRKFTFEIGCIEQFEKRWGVKWQEVVATDAEQNEVKEWADKVSGGMGAAEYPGGKGWIAFKLE